MSKTIESVAQVRHPFLVFMMDEWLLTGPPDYEWFDYSVDLMRNESGINFIGFESKLEFGGITTPWNGLLFTPALTLIATQSRTASLLACMASTGSIASTNTNPAAS